MADDLSLLDAMGQAELVRSGQASPSELVEAAIARIERVDPELNAVIHRRFDVARAEAAGDLPDGPFRGVPLVLKDYLCHSAGDPFHEGMALLQQRSWVEPNDTTLAARFRAAGFVVVGRTNTPELALLPTTEPAAYGPTRNPWDTDRSTGGSSGGSAAAVASGMVPVGHGNDAGGSIRIPASECGLVGLKPSRGRVSNGPEFGDVMGGLVVEHVLTRSVRDTAAVLDAVHGMAPGDPYTAPAPVRPYLTEVGWEPGRLRIGLMSTGPSGDVVVHPSCVAAVEGAGKLLEALGHTVEAAHPTALDDGDHVTHYVTVYAAGTAWALDHWARKTGDAIGPNDVEPLTWALAEVGRAASAADLLTAREWLQVYTRAIASWYDAGFDLLLTPTLAEPPPLLGELVSPPDNPLHALFRAAAIVPFTAPFNSTGQPAISLPLHWDETGLPIGVQLVAPYGREDELLRVAAQLEIAQPWAGALPPVHASGS